MTIVLFCFFKQKTAYEMRIRDWSADVCSSDLVAIDGDRIVAVGENLGAGSENIDAGGKIVTPGFVDVHTHYDGQATWEDRQSVVVGKGVSGRGGHGGGGII